MHYAKLLSGKGLFARFGGWFAECRNDEKRGINEACPALFVVPPIGPVISPIHAISVVRAFSPKCPVAHGSAKTRIANQHPEESPRRDSENSELWSP